MCYDQNLLHCRLYDKCVTIKTYFRLYDKCVTTLRLYLVYNILLHGKCPLGSAVMSTYMPIKGICLSTCRSASLTSLTRVARSPNHSCGSRSSRLSVKKMTEMQKIVSRRVVRGWRSNFVSGQTDGFRRFCRKQFLIWDQHQICQQFAKSSGGGGCTKYVGHLAKVG